ncbi:methenyltetrahydrofolate synthase domain-containing protein-like isoform X2 [Uloborus diversus]|uniref:methenyltetrahydrofolate synthase domain-containing protein-like isoform X2 n=1 Tax=Uloborus diversus TaxID=327109 RepID=UPI002409BA7D|nr:methenyltetrahydrofolate synthase domain-containing protein-like isoform X2 [Uloborus diversus]
MSEITKESIRQNIWTYMEENNISSFPRPVFNRIPNFKGAEQACCKVLLLREFQTAGTVKVNPDKPQQHARFLTLEGVKSYSSKVGLNSKVTVDVVIIGSVAVSLNGRRIGKGEGYADMEFAMMATMGAVNSNTPVITTVHDCQVMESIPDELFGEHDVPVDIIVTPTRIIRCETPFPKPTCILWSLLTDEKLNKIPILRILKEMEKSNH